MPKTLKLNGMQKMLVLLDIRKLFNPFKHFQLANRFTCHIMAKFIWGIEENTFTALTEHSTLHKMANKMLQQSLRCVRYYSKTAAWPLLRKIKPVRFFPVICDDFFKQLALDAMEQKKLLMKQNKQNDVINHLLQLKEKKSLNDVQIAGHTTTVLIDGFETGAIVIAHCLLLVSFGGNYTYVIIICDKK